MEDRLTILMTTDTVGGVWTYSIELCRALEKEGVFIHLAAMGNWPSKEQEEEAAALENVLLYKSDYKLEWMQDPWEDVEQAEKWLNSIYHTVQPDILHFNNYAHRKEDWSCPTITVFHSCVQTWWQAVKGTSAPAIWNKYTNLVSESLNTSDMVVAPTKAIMKKAIATHSISTDTRVIYNGKDLQPSADNEKEDFILCMGRIWDEAKNLQSLSGMAKDLPWPVYVVGNNINPDTGEAVLIENVKFLGELPQEEAHQWQQRAKIFVSPTIYEPFGLAILEAAASGCALVLNELDTLTELWQDTAVFFDPENNTEAKKLILQLNGNESFRSDIAKKAMKRAADFSATKMAAAYTETYRELLAKREFDHDLREEGKTTTQ
ncbi:glycosyltransferase family 4 protein [Antarcticibacterium flavum]|uniref:Glycosyltransferase family 4 protein n=1 Tax=Antarcticibacterium flavum TaxID=2058175 RepID=A0A5B7X3R1_9FLAO|nr:MULTISPECIES: glycosyltransferase family 4 protein [Antarcticibacterium]MCM4161444.1 glycosyl transferase family 1 [Antarcticibacterium sp. W02-3]QCY69318.1 glycosyltransferase family 4 protein [Antarcticibacterium flavum]